MKDKEFNLLDEPWIRVIDKDCGIHEVSLIGLFESAHIYKDLCGELPTQDFAMLRLLLAVLHTVFSRYDVNGNESPLTDTDDALDRWQELWRGKQFPAEVITNYLESQRENFYLFHPERPFYQEAILIKFEKIPNGKYDAQKLNGELSKSKHKARLFTSIGSGERMSLSYEQAARWLLHLNGFDDNALKAGAGIGWLGQLGLISLQGANLYETLMLNFIPYNINKGDVPEIEKPIWENKEKGITEKRHIIFPDNYSELYTLQSRRIILMRSDSRVIGYKILGGDYFDKETADCEPMTIWTSSSKNISYIPKEHNPSVQFWRDFASILPEKEPGSGKGHRSPGVIDWFNLLLDSDLEAIDKNYFLKLRIASVKYCAGQRSSIENIFSDSLQIHALLISNLSSPWRQVVLDSIEFCDIISKKIWWLAKEINLSSGGSNRTKESKGTAEIYAENVKSDFYRRIDSPFRKWLCALNPETDEAEEKRMDWRKKCVDLARQLGNEIIGQAGTDAIFGRSKFNSEDKKKDEVFSAASAMNRFLIGLSIAENQ